MDLINDISPALIGRNVQNAACPEWGVGQVLRIESALFEGRPAHRVSIQFSVGHKTLLIPPAQLIEPTSGQPIDRGGWLDSLAGQAPNDQLRALPTAATQVLGMLEQRVAALAPLYETEDSESDLLRWARGQTQTADPLSRWSRDELRQAFGDFCRNRDEYLRKLVADARKTRGPGVVEEALAAVPAAVRERMRMVL